MVLKVSMVSMVLKVSMVSMVLKVAKVSRALMGAMASMEVLLEEPHNLKLDEQEELEEDHNQILVLVEVG